MEYKLHRKFMPQDMRCADEHYHALAERLFLAEYYAYGGDEVSAEKVEMCRAYADGLMYEEPEYEGDEERVALLTAIGYDDYSAIIENVVMLDRCFCKLLDTVEPLCALSLVRIQMDNLKHIYAETKYPGKVLYKIYVKGRDLNQVKIDGRAINSTELIAELDERFGRVRDMWKKYCQYIHPSREQKDVSMRSYFSYLRLREVPTPRAIKYFSWDMVFINMLITNLLFHRLDELVKVLKEKGKYGKYIREVRRLN